mmetsp:Transcript_32652/g.56919  ORF Transcript_32652/g.56919 Transcript_32652/m.56919 type:complete len:313 (+) Transcript_32652:168-1106(+)
MISVGSMGSATLFIRCARSVAHLKSVHCLATSSIPSTSILPSPLLCFAKAVSTKAGSTNLLLRNDDESTGVTTLTLNNPKKYNVLSWEMLDTLQNQLDDISTNSSIRVLVVGATGKAFSSGHDLNEIHSHQNIEETTELFKKCSQFMISLNKLPQPVIAKVQGLATAAGCQLVASCDLAIGSSESRFGVSGINLGMFCSTPAVALSRVIQRKQAMHMLLTGELITAEKAQAYGLLNTVVPPNLLESEAVKLAEQIASKSNFGIRLGKNMFYEQLKYENLDDAYDFATERIACNLQHPDAKHGIDDFVNKKNK